MVLTLFGFCVQPTHLSKACRETQGSLLLEIFP